MARRSLEALCILVALVIGAILILAGIFYVLQRSSAAHESGEAYAGAPALAAAF